MYVKSNLFQPQTLVHGFFGRKGGVNNSLNCSLKPGISEADVQENRNIICKSLGLELAQLNVLEQTHCNRVYFPIDNTITAEADAMVTNKPNVALGIQTADCTPILLADQTHKVIGAIHAGWKGALAGVISNTVAKMKELGARPENIVCAIGPTIQQDTYEVDSIFQKTFLEKDAANQRFFKDSTRAGHYMFDLPGYCAAELQSTGIEKIDNLKINTYSNPDDYFSFRRSTHQGSPTDCGNQMSVIALL